MISRERARTRRLGVRLAAGVAAVLLAALAAFEAVSLLAWSADAAAVAAVRPAGGVSAAILPFRYRGRTRFLAVRVSDAELAAARRLTTGGVFGKPALVRDAYLRALVRTQSRAHVVAEVAAQLRAVRDELRLDRDEYVELIATCVQDIPYGTPRTAFQLPAATLAAGRGVCVDRSVLLAALLVHEGYDAGLWTIGTRDHVATAVRGATGGYRGSGYAYVEATRRAHVGEVPEGYAGFAGWEAEPRLVVLGSGEAYGADAQTAFLVDERRRAERAARDLAAYASYAARAAGRWREGYAVDARRQADAASLAAQLGAAVDDRAAGFAVLEALQGWRDHPREL